MGFVKSLFIKGRNIFTYIYLPLLRFSLRTDKDTNGISRFCRILFPENREK